MFFGVLAEVTNSPMKHYQGVNSYDDLLLRIQDDFPEIVHYDYRISLNNKFITGKADLKEGDEVAFLPPFAGG